MLDPDIISLQFCMMLASWLSASWFIGKLSGN